MTNFILDSQPNQVYMKTTLRFFVVMGLLLISGFAFSQGITITGTVTSAEDGLPIPGVNVVVQGTTSGTATDLDGNYKVTVTEENATLLFSFIGFKTQSIPVGNQTVINVALESDAQALEEVVVTAMGIERSEE